MGAEPYEYTVPYEPDIQAALEKLRQRVFESKEFNGAELDPPTPEAAFQLTEADGTGSILDINRISDEPDFCCPLFPLKNSSNTLGPRGQRRSWCATRMTSGRTSKEGWLDT